MISLTEVLEDFFISKFDKVDDYIKNPKKIYGACISCKLVKANFNFVNEKALYCAKCKQPGMVDVKNPRCLECHKKQPTYNYPDKTKAAYCSDCKKPEMVDVRHDKCTVCKKVRPNYNFPGEIKPTHCVTCKKPDMINCTNKLCVVCHEVVPTYNFVGEKSPSHCSSCKESTMVDVKHNMCIFCHKIRATYNFKGENNASHCSDCKIDDMINVVDKMCVVCRETQPVFNFPGKARMYCSKCKEPGMINVKDKMCIICKKVSPTFNFPDCIAKYCYNCKMQGMIDVNHASCVVCNNARSYYGYKESDTATHCNKCKMIGMINIAVSKCISCGEISANYNLFGKMPKYCFSCKSSNMFPFPRKKCDTCDEYASYGISLNSRNHCELHKEENEIGFFNSKCANCLLENVIIDENNLCEYCDPDVFQKYKKRKQEEILNILKTQKLNDFICYDKSVESIYKEGCNLKTRPDFLWDCDTHFLVLEVDENGHRNYDCENPRMINISQALGMSTIFLRYNPDNFKVNNKLTKISNKTRQKKLLEWLRYLKTPQENLKGYLVCYYLFFNEYDEPNINPDILLKFDK